MEDTPRAIVMITGGYRNVCCVNYKKYPFIQKVYFINLYLNQPPETMKPPTLLSLILAFLAVSCNNPTETINTPKISLEKANDELLNKGNLSYADSVFSDNYRGQGPEMIRNFVRELRAAFPDLHVSVENKVANGQMSAWTRTHTGTHSEPIMGFMPIGNEISWNSIVVSEVNENGKISDEWGIDDLYNELSQKSLDGVYEYLPPVEGSAIIRSDNFIWVFKDTQTGGYFSEYGKIEFDDGKLIYRITGSNHDDRVNFTFSTRMYEQSGDTVRWEFLNDQDEVTGKGQSLKVSTN